MEELEGLINELFELDYEYRHLELKVEEHEEYLENKLDNVIELFCDYLKDLPQALKKKSKKKTDLRVPIVVKHDYVYYINSEGVVRTKSLSDLSSDTNYQVGRKGEVELVNDDIKEFIRNHAYENIKKYNFEEGINSLHKIKKRINHAMNHFKLIGYKIKH